MTKTTGTQDRRPGAADHVKPLFHRHRRAARRLPAARTVSGVVRERRINALAVLILAVNAVSLVLSCVSGDPRLMLAKDGAVSSTVAVGILVSVLLGRPMMSTVVKPSWSRATRPARPPGRDSARARRSARSGSGAKNGCSPCCGAAVWPRYRWAG
ncbi:VC0807 family protein [Streptomyces nogalater]|uniref:VC0807 family protein n=1 Tax=Streptomyces nogalater TaxID=38314 RepID=A0ABW0WQI7_STRNO